MDTALERGISLFQENPIYWASALLWLFGFAAYVPAACGRGRLALNRTGMWLCWLGFAMTVIAHFALDGSYRVPRLEQPTLELAYWRSSNTQIWLLWIARSAFIIASWLGWLTQRAGWLGLAAAMLGVFASWFTEESTRHAVIAGGTAILVVFLLVATLRGELRRQRAEPGDYEAELIRLCGGSRRQAERLIRAEMKRQPGVSQAGAALAAVTRLRHERDPPTPL